MRHLPPLRALQGTVTSFFRSGDALRGRSVGGVVLSGKVDVPAPAPRLAADWAREVSSRMVLEPGDVEVMPLARARARWPDYPLCVQAMADWTSALGLKETLAAADVALMVCRGARYHHDGAEYGAAAFCNLFLSDDRGLDVFFPLTGDRIPLTRGTALMFDTGQPHGVIPRHRKDFDAADFAPGHDLNQFFLTWELPIENAYVAHALGVSFDMPASLDLQGEEEGIRIDGERVAVCPRSGRWLSAGSSSASLV